MRLSRPQTLLLGALAALSLAPTAVHAIGDFPCAGSSDSQSCADWSTDANAQGTISADAECVPDPIGSGISYCGYARAACTQATDCDYGSCGSDGFCAGYVGDECPNGDIDCQAFFFCGTNGRCGGDGAACANGDPSSPIPNPEQQCESLSCDETAMTCEAPPSDGMEGGSPCGVDSVCASDVCQTDSTCQAVSLAAPSQAARQKKKRFVVGPGAGVAKFFGECKRGFTACLVASSEHSENYECVNTDSNLEQCGGCANDGGVDCTDLPGVEGVMCDAGRCVVLSCKPGLERSTDLAACV